MKKWIKIAVWAVVAVAGSAVLGSLWVWLIGLAVGKLIARLVIALVLGIVLYFLVYALIIGGIFWILIS